MKNTLENKAKFFAQYWGQKVQRQWVSENDNGLFEVRASVGGTCWLELKPLSQISDEDAVELGKVLSKYFSSPNGKSGYAYYSGLCRDFIKITMKLADFVDKARVLGYACQWNEITVDQQIEWGWIKLEAE